MRTFYSALVIVLLPWMHAFGFQKNEPGKGLSIRKTPEPITLDGNLQEPAWQKAEIATNFYLNYPTDTTLATFQTEARLTFDDDFLYVSFVCYDDATPDIVQSLRRDYDFGSNDNVAVVLGPYNDKINGFFFTITPRGVQLEGLVSSGGSSDNSYNATWDNKWYSKVVKHSDRWIAEIAIPFKSIRYKSGLTEWNITFLRNDLKRNQVSSWIATPIQFIPAAFAYSGQLQWEDPLPEAGKNISLIPYIAGIKTDDQEEEPAKHTSDLQVGLDAKVAITPSLNLDLTVNPDFSQVEVDQQVINLSRFEFRFPERRQFFLENNDLFDNAGFPEARPFFSRRIGIASDSSDNLVRVPILYGARLSGSLSEKWRTSLLNMHTRASKKAGLPDQNYTVAAIQRNFWKQSNITLTFVDKESIGITEGDTTQYFNEDLWKEKIQNNDTIMALNRFNRVLTVDVDLLSADNAWKTSVFLSHSFDDFSQDKRLSGGTFFNYTKRNFQAYLGNNFVQKNYNAEAGFVPSSGVYPGVYGYFTGANVRLFPQKNKIANHGPGYDIGMNTLPDGTPVDKFFNLSYNFNFLNTSSVSFGYSYTFQRLTSDFNPIDDSKYTLFLEDEEYTWSLLYASYQSDQRKRFTYFFDGNGGQFYNGNSFGIRGNLSYRIQPYGSVSMRFDYNDLKFPDNYGKEKLFVIGPKIDLTFTDKLFLTTYLQYNNSADNMNLNARFQWRFKPASDFFIVYTENYLPEHLISKNRSLVLKLTYWLNI